MIFISNKENFLINMKNKLLTVTIGIPAYNEEANIRKLLNSLVKQREDDICIEKIVMVNDGSTDATETEVSKVKDNKIEYIALGERCGQVFCQNLIFSQATTDVVVILEADTCPTSRNYIRLLVEPLMQGVVGGLVQGNTVPMESGTFIGRLLQTQALIYQRTIMRENSLTEALCSGRGGRAFAKEVYKNLRWPSNVPEDSYAMLWCKRNKFQTYMQKEATCYFKAPETIHDFLLTRAKTISGRKALRMHFTDDELKKIYTKRCDLMGRMAYELLIINPVYFFVYVILAVYVQIMSINKVFIDYWTLSSSTKNLYKLAFALQGS